MNPKLYLSALTLILFGTLSLTVTAAAPPLMNYQGQLTDPSGTALDTTVSMTFTIYADSVTTTTRWSETHSSVTVSEGLFSVVLGSVQMLDYSVFDTTTLWLGIKVESDPEMSPRSRIVSAAFAQRVVTIDNTSGGTVYGSIDLTSDLDVGGKATIGGNHTNTGAYGFVAGRDNAVTGDWATIGGGLENEASGLYATVGGGTEDTAAGEASTVAGGRRNRARGKLSAIGGGIYNEADSIYCFIGGGWSNFAEGGAATVGGGGYNKAQGWMSTIAGGWFGRATDTGATIAGGGFNNAHGVWSFIGGGGGFDEPDSNTAGGDYSVIVGGSRHVANGLYSMIPGGLQNTADGNYSLAAGRRAKALHDGAFVWADQTDADFASTGDGQFLIRASGGVGIGTNNPSEALDVTGNLNVSGDIYGNVDNADRVDGQHYNGNWPTTLANVQGAASNDFHNIGGTDEVDDAVADCADVNACAYTGNIGHWRWYSTFNSTGTIYDNGYVIVRRISSSTTFQCECGHGSGCTYIYYVNGVRTAGILSYGGTVNINMGAAPSDGRVYFAKRANGLDVLMMDVVGTNNPYFTIIGHDTN